MQNIIQEESTLSGIYKSLFEFNPAISYALDREGKFVLVNDTMVQVTGYSRKELTQLTFPAILQEDCKHATIDHFYEILKGKKKVFEAVILNKSGAPIDLYVTAVPIIIEGKILGVAGVAHDITENKQIKMELTESKNQLENIFNSIDICSWSAEADGSNFLQISSACQKLFGYSREEFKENPHLWLRTIHQEHREEMTRKAKGLLAGQSFTAEYRIIDRNGVTKWLYMNALPVFDDQHEVIRLDGVMFDISQRREAEKTLYHVAFHDDLTDLPNRRMFETELSASLSEAKRSKTGLAVLYLDLDSFKMINDTLGHRTGDRLLQVMAGRISSCVGTAGLVARQGGDEFAIILNRITDRNQVVEVIKRILRAVAQPVILEGHEYSFTTSIGVSMYPDHAEIAEELIKKADQAMYKAKENGKNDFRFYHAGMTDRLARRVQLLQDLRKAVSNKELHLLYQPIMDVQEANVEIVGFEALLRWNHPLLGVISPAEFIPIAEESGLIVRIGEWMIKEACEEGKMWQQHLPDVYVSVNISARQLEDSGFIDKVEEILCETALNPAYLKMEITESVMMKNVDEMALKIHQLGRKGIEFFLDDFGTGYSSLSYLERLPINTLKIDKSFVRDIKTNSNQETIIRTIVGMASNLHMKVVAEGVEQEEQLSFLNDIGCSGMQGFLFSKPLPYEEIEQWFPKKPDMINE